MDPQRLLLLAVFLLVLGRAVNDLLRIFGLTRKIIVQGGDTTRAVAIVAHAASAIGAFLLVVLLIVQGDFMLERFACFVGK